MPARQLVLVVNPDPKEQRVLSVSLRKAGLDVRAVDDGTSALRILDETDDVGIAIIELNLPDLDGFEVCTRVRENPRHRHLALVAVTGSRDLATKLRAFEVGFDELLTKPVYVKELATRVDLLLHRRRTDALADTDEDQAEGEIDPMGLTDLLQAISERGRTAVVRVERGDEIGEIWFKEGDVIDAEVGTLRGETALYRLLRWAEGRYTVKYVDRANRRRRIQRPTRDVLADGLERVERIKALVDRLPMDAVLEVDYAAIGQEIESMPGAVRRLLHQFDGFRSLSSVASSAPVGDLEALRLAERLLERGHVVQVAAPETTAEPRDEDDTDARSSVINAWLGDPSEPVDAAGIRTHDIEPIAEWSTPSDDDGDDEPLVLKTIARNEAQAAREQEDAARRNVEARTQQTGLPPSRPASSSSPSVGTSPPRPGPAVPGGAARPGGPQGPRPSPAKVREQVMAALADAELSLEKRDLEPPQEPDPTPVEPIGDVADHDETPEEIWEKEVQKRARTFQIETVEHVLRPMTRMPDEPEPQPADTSRASRHLHDLASLAGDEELEIDVDVEPAGTVRGPSHLGGEKPQRTQPGVREGRPAVEMVQPAAIGEQTPARTSPATTIPGAQRPARRQADGADDDTPVIPSLGSPNVRRSPSASAAASTPTAGATPQRAGAERAPERGTPPHEARGEAASPAAEPAPKREEPAPKREEPARETAPGTGDPGTTAPGLPTSPPRTEASAGATPTEAPSTEPEEPAKGPGDSWDHDFFKSDVEPAASSGSRLGLVAIVLLIAIVIGGFVWLVRSGEDEAGTETPTDEGVTATGADDGQDEEQPEQPEGGDEEDPFEDAATESSDSAVVDPRTEPGYIDAVYRGRSAAAAVVARAIEIVDAMSGTGATQEEGATTEETPTTDGDTVTEDTTDDREPEVAETKDEETDTSPEPDPEPEKDVKIEKAPEPKESAYDQGKKAYKRRKYKDAIKHLEKAVAASPGNRDAQYMLGMAYSKTRKYPLALKHLEKARGAKKGSATFWKELGTVYIRLEKEKSGLDAYQKAVDILGPDHPDAKTMQAYIDSRR